MKRSKLPLVFLLIGVFLLLFILTPIGNIFYTQLVIDLPGLVKTVRDPAVLNSIWLSVYTAFLATLVAFFLGTPLAYFLARSDFWGKGIINNIIDLPMVIPHIAAGIILYGVFNPSGPVGGPLSNTIIFQDAVPGIVVAMLFVSVPFFVNSAREGFESVDPRLENISRTLGESPWGTFYKVSFPLAFSNILTGCLLAWARGISEYAAVAIIAYFPKTAPILIRDRFTSYGLASSRPATLLLIFICLVIFTILRTVSSKR